jgi:hypothetical protein
MKIKQKLAAIATGAFILSHFLPAYGSTGFGCFSTCLSIALRPDGDLNVGLGGWMYYSGFVVVNLLFPVLAFTLMFSVRCFSRTRCWLSLLISLQVLSWLLVNIKNPSSLGMGYYVWLGAFVLLLFAHILNHPASNPDTCNRPGGKGAKLWLFVKTRAVRLLAVVSCFCWCGCESVRDASFTGRLWHERDYVVPSPDPKLALNQTPQGILVQYDAEYERNGDIHRRAYYLEPNMKRVAAGQKPVFVDPAKAGPQTIIPILPRPAADGLPPELRAVCSSNFCTFTIYRGKQVLGPCDLPVFSDQLETAKQVALTPLAVTGDASVVAAVIWVIWHGGGAASNPDGTPSNF